MTIATIDTSSNRGSDRARARARRRRAGPEAHRRRLRVLDLHPQRHRHVLGAVRGLCGVVGQYRRRTDRSRAVQSPQCLHRDDVSAVLELYMRARGVVRRTAAAGALLDLRRPHIRARCGLSVHRGLGIRRHGGEGRRALAQRLSVRLFHFGRHARRPRHRRPDLAHLYGGAGRSPRACEPPCCGACCAGACSGTRWTSSGSGYSRWSI